MTERNTGNQNTELDMLRRELADLKRDNEERIRCECISNAAMKAALEQNHPEDEINHFLASIGQSLEVDRIYIFEDDFEADVTNNTYEWCAESVSPEIENLQEVPRTAVTWWYDQFEKGNDIHIPDLEAIKETEPVTYSYLQPQGIRSLIAKRLVLGDKVIGFFGVDNPRLELMADISVFLNTLSNFLAALIQNRNIYQSREVRHVAELEEKNQSLNEALLQAKEANEAKSQFLSNMSHDIRTPLNAIIGMTSIASNHINDKDRVQDCLHKITLSGKHLLGLINDVLDMAKIESGKMSLHMEEMSLPDTLDSICEITRGQIKEKGQHFDIITRDILCEDVLCDNIRFNQVLLNLLSNSIKFTPQEGSISLSLWQEESPKGKDYVLTHISVADTGIGMTEEFQKTIFESFTREDAKRVHKTQGTGLGMAITKRILDSMNGTIALESELDKGTTFHITLDLCRVPYTESKMQLPAWKILIVDDNEDLCLAAAESLKELGAEPEWCLDGETALKMVISAHEHGEDYFAIVIDYRMPGMNGVETVKRIRNVLGDKTPIDMISAYDLSDIRDEAKEAGVIHLLPKPLFKSTLYHELCRFAEDHYLSPASEWDPGKLNLSGMHILLAEDNDLNAEIALMILEESGATADHAEDG